MSQLFSTFSLSQLTLQNRIVIAPMCQYSAIQGQATDWHKMHYGSLAHSGAGLLIIEAAAVRPEGRISLYDIGLWNDATANALRDLIQSIRAYSAMPIGIQLAHAGRKGSMPAPWQSTKYVPAIEGGWETVAPSALAFSDDYLTPHSLNQSEIKTLISAFAEAATRADEAGIDVIEIHAAHGYLLHQFLSPLSNQRNDNYGGTLENRMRLTLDVFKAIRTAFPINKAVGIRISATDWVEGGWDLAQSLILCQALKELGCSFIHVSSGGLSTEQRITLTPNYQIPLAETIKKTVNLPTIAVGLITEATQAEAIIATGQSDLIALGRTFLYNPHWPWQAAAELGAQVRVPPQYLRSQPQRYPHLFK